MNPMMIALVAALTLAGPVLAEEAGHDHAHDPAQAAPGAAAEPSGHVASLGAVRLVHAWSRATEGGEALVFLEIENGGDSAVTLEGAESAVAKTVEVVGFQLAGGAGAYVGLGALSVAAHGTMALAPEQAALRLTGLTAPLHQGETFPMEIHLSSGHVPVVVAIEAATAHQHSHAGHKH